MFYLYLYIKPDDLVIKVHKPTHLVWGKVGASRPQKVQTVHILRHQPQITCQKCQLPESLPHQRDDCFQNWNIVQKHQMR